MLFRSHLSQLFGMSITKTAFVIYSTLLFFVFICIYSLKPKKKFRFLSVLIFIQYIVFVAIFRYYILYMLSCFSTSYHIIFYLYLQKPLIRFADFLMLVHNHYKILFRQNLVCHQCKHLILQQALFHFVMYLLRYLL